jgi:fructose-bisphosphate aldolase, class II
LSILYYIGGDDYFVFELKQLRKRRKTMESQFASSIDSDGPLAMTAVLRKIFAENPGEFDPRKYLGPARDELIKMVKYKNKHVLMSAGKA